MPMELARCPECGAQVGGQHHSPTAGVRRATDFEGQFARAAAPAAAGPAAAGPAAAEPARGLAALFGRFGI